MENWISFCTACKDRLYHLKVTLPKNIKDNANYEKLEFVILDYNSKDNLYEWIKENMMEQIKSGRVVYYKTEKPNFFHRSHSRNMMFRLAHGEILCNIDADNFTGRDFAKYVNSKFQKNKKVFLTSIDFKKIKKNYYPPSDTLGRVCFRKKDFLEIKGYDEQMITHGFQDYDFVNRLELNGIKRTFIDGIEFFKIIRHTDDRRLFNEPPKDSLKSIFIRYIDHICSDILFMYKNNTYERGIITDNKAVISGSYKNINEGKIEYEYSIARNEWEKGTWIQNDKIVKLIGDNNEVKLQIAIFHAGTAERKLLISKEKEYYFKEIVQQESITKLTLFNRQITNRNRMYNNYKNKNIRVNKNGFGKGTAIKNFDNSNRILLI